MRQSKQSRGEAVLEVFAIIAAVTVAGLGMIGYGIWWLIDQAGRGNDIAIVILTGAAFLITVWGTIWVNQKQDERAARVRQMALADQTEDTQQALITQARALLEMQRVQTEAAKTAVTQAKLPGQEAQLRQLLEEYLANGGTAVPVDDYFIVNDDAYSDLGGGL